MLTIKDNTILGWYAECLSTDEKPLDVPNGAKLYVFDLQELWMFDKDSFEWIKQ